jgi:hypothetical protein
MRKSCVAYVDAFFDGVPIFTDATAILPPASGRRRVTTQCADLRNCLLRVVERWEKWHRRSISAAVCIRCLTRQTATVTMPALNSWLCLLSTSKRY